MPFLDLQAVIDSKPLPFVYQAVKKVQATCHYPVSFWLKELTDDELFVIVELILTSESELTLHQFIYLTEVLALGEGLEFANDHQESVCRVAVLQTLVMHEVMLRKGFIPNGKLLHANMTLGEEFDIYRICPFLHGHAP